MVFFIDIFYRVILVLYYFSYIIIHIIETFFLCTDYCYTIIHIIIIIIVKEYKRDPLGPSPYGKTKKKIIHSYTLCGQGNETGVDPASELALWCGDVMLAKHGVTVIPGDKKNRNKNPVAERAVQEIEAELPHWFCHLVGARSAIVTTTLTRQFVFQRALDTEGGLLIRI